MRVLIAGSMHWTRRDVIVRDVADLFERWPNAVVVVGGMGECDRMVREAVEATGRSVEVVPRVSRRRRSMPRAVRLWIERCRPDVVAVYSIGGAPIVGMIYSFATKLGIPTAKIRDRECEPLAPEHEPMVAR